jgi:hypothetical protein
MSDTIQLYDAQGFPLGGRLAHADTGRRPVLSSDSPHRSPQGLLPDHAIHALSKGVPVACLLLCR